MLDQASEIIGMEIYGPNGIFVGKVSELVMDPEFRSITGIIISSPSPVIADKGVMLKIPYRWVQAIGDIIILKAFPNFISEDGTVS